MRDIVTASYSHAPKSGTLNKTEYKSYKDFLENYSDNKNSKDDGESVSSTDSGVSSCKLLESKSNNTSTSSLNSDVNGTTYKIFSKAESTPTVTMGGRTGSFRNYMENYTNKKFSPVNLVKAPKPNVIKSEIVIQVNDPLEFEKTIVINPDSAFRQNVLPPLPSQQERKPPSKFMQQTDISIPTPPPPPPSILMQQTKSFIPPPPPPLLLQQADSFIPPPPPPPPMLLGCNTINQGKKWTTVETEHCRTNSDQPKIPKNNMAAANLAKILNEHVLARRKISDTESPTPIANGEACATLNHTNKTILNGNVHKASTLPRQERKIVIPSVAPTKMQHSLPKHKFLQNTVPIPSPPKLPQQMTRTQRSISPKTTNGLNCNVDSVDYCTTTVVPVIDGSATVNKGDPNVKKLVYNTYRGLLGAYNNKANDMISTLPRNMVREDKGVTKQVESISLQCRLEKLNGRINPKIEQE